MSIAAKKKLESEIKDLKEALDSEFTPNNFKDDIRKEIAKSEAELEKLIKAEKDEKAAPPQKKPVAAKKKDEAVKKVQKRVKAVKQVKKVAAKKQTQVKKEEKKSALQKVRERKQKMASAKKPTAKKSTPTKVPASSLKDASRKALKPGWRVSKEGNRYYEGRANRSDSQRRKYPYLEDGGFVNEGAGMFAKGGEINRKGTYTGRIVKADDGTFMIGKISGYRSSGEPVYDTHNFGELKKDMREKVGELGNNKIKELLKKQTFAKGGEVSDEVEQLWRGYSAAILFAEIDMETDEPLDWNYSVDDFDAQTVSDSKEMLHKYYMENKDAIAKSGLDLFVVGNDIWYTRAGHGVGFFDHSLDSDVEKRLIKGAKMLGEYPTVETYNGKISVRGGRIFNDYAKGGKVGKFKVGQSVIIVSDNDNYDEYKDKELVITHKATSKEDHPGFDSSMEGEGLYDLKVKKTGEEVPFSLYDYEIKRYADGGFTNTGAGMFANGGNVGDWSVTDISNAKYLGVIEFQDNEGEYHNFEVMETDDRLVFGGMTNTGFIESGYIEKDGSSTDETLQSLIQDLEVYYNDGAEYTSQIVFNQRMADGGFTNTGAGMFAKGGIFGTKRNLSRDRMFKSQEDWEIKYKRKSKPKNPTYKKHADGGELHKSEFADGGAIVDYTEGTLADPRFDINSPIFAKGGKISKKYNYLSKYKIATITTEDGVVIDGSDIIDGLYVKKSVKL